MINLNYQQDMKTYQEKLYKEIQGVSDYTPQEKVRELGTILLMLNARDNDNIELFALAKRRGLI